MGPTQGTALLFMGRRMGTGWFHDLRRCSPWGLVPATEGCLVVASSSSLHPGLAAPAVITEPLKPLWSVQMCKGSRGLRVTGTAWGQAVSWAPRWLCSPDLQASLGLGSTALEKVRLTGWVGCGCLDFFPSCLWKWLLFLLAHHSRLRAQWGLSASPSAVTAPAGHQGPPAWMGFGVSTQGLVLLCSGVSNLLSPVRRSRVSVYS